MPLQVEPQHLAMARAFMMRPPAPLPKAVGGPVPVKKRIPLSPNMTSFVESPQGSAILQQMLGQSRQRRNPGAQQVNSIGQV